MEVTYIQHYGDDLIVCNAARVSFDKKSEWEIAKYEEEVDVEARHIFEIPVYKLSAKDEKLVNYLAKAGHTSCFEHMGATLKLKVPIFVARQIQRHRTFSYNEISRRYVDNEPEFFWPDKWRKRADNVKQGSSNEYVDLKLLPGHSKDYLIGKLGREHLGWSPNISTLGLEAMLLSLYDQMLEQGVAPEQARIILPQNMYTEFYMTGNLRAWSHFLRLRLDEHTQNETRQVAEMVKEILEPLFPVSMKALMEN